MSEPTANTAQETVQAAPVAAQVQGTPSERTFTQADVDAIVQKRVSRVTKGIPDDEELNAFRKWKESQQTEKERWDTLTKERDDSRAKLKEAEAELEQFRREKFLLSKGVKAEDVDYYAFKIGKLVTDTTDFETAATQYIKENLQKEQDKTVRVDFTAPLSGGHASLNPNDAMNSLIRGVRK